MTANPPSNKIYDFVGNFRRKEQEDYVEPLSLENTLWSNTVLASSGHVYGLVIYTGKETRAMMNSENPRSKNGLLELEVNFLSKILFLLMALLSLAILLLNGVYTTWYIYYFRFVLLLSSIIPISLRVNLDLAKIWYSVCIAIDNEIPGTIPRNSTIPEELGRIQYLLSDKTGTLTQNSMTFKKLTMEHVRFSDVCFSSFDINPLGGS